MKKFSVAMLLLAALGLPIALFLLLWSNTHLHGLLVAAIAVSIGWVLNVAWAFAVQGTTPAASSTTGNFVSIATRFGWACPMILVLLTWGVWRLFA